jgi:hypothetical protein
VLTALVVSLAWSSAADAVPKAKASDLDGIETAYAQYRTRTVRAAPRLSPGCLSQLEPKALRPRCSSHALCSALPVPLPACAGCALRLLRPRLWLLQPSASAMAGGITAGPGSAAPMVASRSVSGSEAPGGSKKQSGLDPDCPSEGSYWLLIFLLSRREIWLSNHLVDGASIALVPTGYALLKRPDVVIAWRRSAGLW